MSQVLTKIRALFRGQELPEDDGEPFADEVTEQEWSQLLAWAREDEAEALSWMRPAAVPPPLPADALIDDQAEWAALAARAKAAAGPLVTLTGPAPAKKLLDESGYAAGPKLAATVVLPPPVPPAPLASMADAEEEDWEALVARAKFAASLTAVTAAPPPPPVPVVAPVSPAPLAVAMAVPAPVAGPVVGAVSAAVAAPAAAAEPEDEEEWEWMVAKAKAVAMAALAAPRTDRRSAPAVRNLPARTSGNTGGSTLSLAARLERLAARLPAAAKS